MNHVQLLHEHLLAETEGERSPAQTTGALNDAEIQAELESSGIRTLQAVLESEWSRRVRSLTVFAWSAMTPHEQAAMATWTERQIRILSERLCLMRRNQKPEPAVPAIYRAVRP